ncbi:GNAT family N-acetyltransferase [Chitinimonas lacunae]|uniref:GNAT family N-acetyltransferase n=1 Tax=Chitinimonas lacunae TaxID=1963018 RepID=A0ABV8MLN2_9NEIS
MIYSRLLVDLASQTLTAHDAHGRVLKSYPVSTAANGPGERRGSFCTPRGRHRIRAAIGAGLPADAVFVGRRPTGEHYSEALAAEAPGRDWILARILWLCGTQPRYNRFGEVDSMRRYIYLHGCPDSVPLGRPGSHGCIRMRNADLIELFDRLQAGCEVVVLENAAAPLSADEMVIRALPWRLATDAAAVREQVFIREMGVPAEVERDAADATALHLVAWDRFGRAVGCARLLPDGWVGRMAVVSDWRGRGVGARLLTTALELASGQGWPLLRLNAQADVCGFYARYGFVPDGEPFMAAGILHQRMRRSLVDNSAIGEA